MVENATHDVIVGSIVDLGHNLGLRVIGEGVETQAVLVDQRDRRPAARQPHDLTRMSG